MGQILQIYPLWWHSVPRPQPAPPPRLFSKLHFFTGSWLSAPLHLVLSVCSCAWLSAAANKLHSETKLVMRTWNHSCLRNKGSLRRYRYQRSQGILWHKLERDDEICCKLLKARCEFERVQGTLRNSKWRTPVPQSELF